MTKTIKRKLHHKYINLYQKLIPLREERSKKQNTKQINKTKAYILYI